MARLGTRRHCSGEEGSVLFPVMAASVVVAIVTASMLVVARQSVNIQQLRRAHIQVYVLGRGIARQILEAFKADNLSAMSADYTSTSGSVNVSSSMSADIVHLEIRSQVGGAKNVIEFDYSTLTHSVVGWRDEGPFGSP